MNLSLVQNFLAKLVRRQSRLFFPAGAGAYAPLEDLLEKLMSSSGEVSALVTAREILDRYKQLRDDEKLRFFQLLESKFNADADEVRVAFRDYDKQPGSLNLSHLCMACEPRRRELLRRLNQTAGATHDLVSMRADLLGLLRENPGLRAVDDDFVHLFTSWFARSFLVLQTIDWSTSAQILERIIRYEAVHQIQDWDDLRRRIEPENRRCFAFFHPSLVDEPLIFVEIALSNRIPASIKEILRAEGDQEPADDFDTATFYSISNCQPGLRNVSFGNLLIKQVVQELQSEYPSIKHFVTLSPIPGMRSWMEAKKHAADPDLSALAAGINGLPNTAANAALEQETLKRLAAEYLVNARRGIHPLDPVARFHLGNGARVHQIRIAADTSQKGLDQSRGIMVNYLYDLRSIERNHEQFMTEGKIDCSPDILKLLQKKKSRKTRTT